MSEALKAGMKTRREVLGDAHEIKVTRAAYAEIGVEV